MSMTNDMLKALSAEEIPKDYKDSNNDFDFSEVLKSCGTKTISSHVLRFADGQEKVFSFNN